MKQRGVAMFSSALVAVLALTMAGCSSERSYTAVGASQENEQAENPSPTDSPTEPAGMGALGPDTEVATPTTSVITPENGTPTTVTNTPAPPANNPQPAAEAKPAPAAATSKASPTPTTTSKTTPTKKPAAPASPTGKPKAPTPTPEPTTGVPFFVSDATKFIPPGTTVKCNARSFIMVTLTYKGTDGYVLKKDIKAYKSDTGNFSLTCSELT